MHGKNTAFTFFQMSVSVLANILLVLIPIRIRTPVWIITRFWISNAMVIGSPKIVRQY